MKKTILILAVLFAFYGANSQTVVKDKQGNYIAVKAIKDSTQNLHRYKRDCLPCYDKQKRETVCHKDKQSR